MLVPSSRSTLVLLTNLAFRSPTLHGIHILMRLSCKTWWYSYLFLTPSWWWLSFQTKRLTVRFLEQVLLKESDTLRYPIVTNLYLTIWFFLQECSRTLERSDCYKERGRICLWREVHFFIWFKLKLEQWRSSKKCERLNNILAERELEYNHERQRIDDTIRLLTLELDKLENMVFNVFLFNKAFLSDAQQMPVDVQYTTSQELRTIKVWYLKSYVAHSLWNVNREPSLTKLPISLTKDINFSTSSC